MSYSSPKEKTTCILTTCVKLCKPLTWSKKKKKRKIREEEGRGTGKREEGRMERE